MSKFITIAVDGYSSSGKSSMAKELARAIGYNYIDSGAMYRAVALYCLNKGYIAGDGVIDTAALESDIDNIAITFSLNPSTGRSDTCLNGENVESEIRSMRVSNCVSEVAALPFVRRALVKQQQAMRGRSGIVMDGRDIGTVVFPDAEMKVFVNASARVRAERRHKELIAKGQQVSFDEVLRNVEERDRLDTTRADSPLRCADDAEVLNNDNMTIEEQNRWMLDTFHRKLAEATAAADAQR